MRYRMKNLVFISSLNCIRNIAVMEDTLLIDIIVMSKPFKILFIVLNPLSIFLL
jgi:hypothetical protein